MSNEKPTSSGTLSGKTVNKSGAGNAPKPDRQARLSAALRENLKRRKQAARSDTQNDSGKTTDGDTDSGRK